MKKPFLILLCGASGSGKTTIANKVAENITLNLKVGNLCQDNFYKKIEDLPILNGKPNYDHPNSFDWNKIKETINCLMDGKSSEIQLYDYENHCESKKIKKLKNVDVIIFEGLYSLFDFEINKLADLKIFIDTAADECFIRRLERDVIYRGRSREEIIERWRTNVRPMYQQFILNLKNNADIVIPWNESNINKLNFLFTTIDLLVQKK